MKKATLCSAAMAAASFTGVAVGDTIFDTGLPGGMFGYIGYDIGIMQSVTVAFTPAADYTLDDIGVWIMSNDFDNPGRTYTLSLRPDAFGGATEPSSTIIESWDVATSAVGWMPVLETVTSALNPILEAGKTYWIVAESTEGFGQNPVWVWGSNSDPVLSGNIDFASGPEWQIGTTFGSAPGTVVNATLIPAPATLVFAGLAGIVTRRRR